MLIIIIAICALLNIVFTQEIEDPGYGPPDTEFEDNIEEKREMLRWFPVDKKDECKNQPGPEQVQNLIIK